MCVRPYIGVEFLHLLLMLLQQKMCFSLLMGQHKISQIFDNEVVLAPEKGDE